MAFYLSLFLLFALRAVADTILPTDIAPPTESAQLAIKWSPDAVSFMVFDVDPLTLKAGMGQQPNAIATVFEQGLLVIPTDSGNSTTANQIAFLCCDLNNDSDLDPSQIFTNVQSKNPKAILLYSTQADSCNLTETSDYSSVFTMTNVTYSNKLSGFLNSSAPASTNNATIATRAILLSSSNNASSTDSAAGASETGSGDNDGATPAPTTAVAMSILYSITGIITLLFLIIIATGAVRAHRHPERYGPRNGFPGRPRQSRAKGLARAMLETLPIVKFGDPEPDKPARDVELESANANVAHNEPAVAAGGREDGETPRDGISISAEQEGGLGPNQAPSTENPVVSGSGDGDLGCSICTEDFTIGEDVRVLPCNHKYHPACIDPWLLNVSGTCPLCRVDLRPTQSNTSQLPSAEDFEEPTVVTEATEADTAGPEPNTGPSSTRRRMSRLLDFNRLRHAEPEERIAALRRLRTQDRAAEPTPNGEGDEGALSQDEASMANNNGSGSGESNIISRDAMNRRSRFTRTLRAAFDIRTVASTGTGERPAPPAGDASMVGGRGA